MSLLNLSGMRFLRLVTSILDPRQRRRYAVLQSFMLFAAVVQVTSVASIAPFIALVAEPQLIHEQPIARAVYIELGFASDRAFLIVFALALMVLIVVANVVPAVMTWLMWSFSKRLGAELQADVFRGYVHGDLSRYARVNSSQRISVVVHGVNRLVYLVIQPFLQFVASAFVIALISVALFAYDPMVAISAFLVVGGGYLVVYAVTKSRLARHGRKSWAVVEAKQRLLSECLGGVKEIRLAGTGERYEARLKELTEGALRSESMIGLLGDLPRYALESVALCALLGLGVTLLARRDDPAGVVAVLSLYAMAGYRLLPAAQAMFRSASTMRANVEAIGDIAPDLAVGRALAPARAAAPAVAYPTDGAIEFRHVWFSYPGAPEPVLRDVSFRIERRAITAIIGSSGAGKSTTVDLLLGLLQPTRGEVTVGGTAIARSPESWHRHVAFVSQSVFLVDDTVAANIAFGSLGEVDPARVRRAARLANVDAFVTQLPGQYDYVVGEDGALLSGGQRQRIGIARALYNDADVIVLDEPTSALDAVTEREVMATLEALRETKTIVIISHRLSTLRSADQVLLLDGGQVAGTGTFDEVLEVSPHFQALVATGA